MEFGEVINIVFEVLIVSILNFGNYFLYNCQPFAAGGLMTIVHLTQYTKMKLEN